MNVYIEKKKGFSANLKIGTDSFLSHVPCQRPLLGFSPRRKVPDLTPSALARA